MHKNLFIRAINTVYTPDDLKDGQTMTVRELIDKLEEYDDNRRIILSFDNGYTYGGITEQDFDWE